MYCYRFFFRLRVFDGYTLLMVPPTFNLKSPPPQKKKKMSMSVCVIILPSVKCVTLFIESNKIVCTYVFGNGQEVLLGMNNILLEGSSE